LVVVLFNLLVSLTGLYKYYIKIYIYMCIKEKNGIFKSFMDVDESCKCCIEFGHLQIFLCMYTASIESNKGSNDMLSVKSNLKWSLNKSQICI